MNKLSHDLLYSLALELDLPDLINFCKTNEKINKYVCENDKIWISKLIREFPEYNKINLNLSKKNLYVLLWKLSNIKRKLNLKQDVYTIYHSKKLRLSHEKIKKIPEDIKILNNLEELSIYSSEVEELPNEFPKSLKELNLAGNKIKKIPNTLPSSLIALDVSRNRLEELPDILPSSLEDIFVDNNKLTSLPDSLPEYLKHLDISHNLIPLEEIERIKKKYPRLKFVN